MKKVRFYPKVQVVMIKCSNASKESRKGPWMKMACNRRRFEKRIRDTERKISFCLDPIHRQHILCNLL